MNAGEWAHDIEQRIAELEVKLADTIEAYDSWVGDDTIYSEVISPNLDALIEQDNLDKPAFQHDSDCCTFLGGYVHEGERYDLYWCAQKQLGIPTVIARWGDDGGDYYSGMVFTDDNVPLREAKRRAIDRALIEQDAGEWVEWTWGNATDGYIKQRCRPDGTDTEFTNAIHKAKPIWHAEPSNSGVPRAYRAGLAQGQKVRDAAVLTLMESVYAVGIPILEPQEGPPHMTGREWNRIMAAAAKVKCHE